MIKEVNVAITRKGDNIIKNGDFAYPKIDANSFRFLNKTALPPQPPLSIEYDSALFVWNYKRSDEGKVKLSHYTVVAIGNRNYGNINIGEEQQYIDLYGFSNLPTTLSQTVNIKTGGFYNLSFYYSKRRSYTNVTSIYIDDNLIDTITDVSIDYWSLYSRTIYVSKLGDLKISFVAVAIQNLTSFMIKRVSFSFVGFNLFPYKIIPTNFANQVISQTNNKITKANLKETQQIVNTKKWIGGTKNTDSSGYIKKKTSNAITATAI
jgi:hypothetical protein